MDCYIVLSIVLSLDIWNQQESKFKRLRFEITYIRWPCPNRNTQGLVQSQPPNFTCYARFNKFKAIWTRKMMINPYKPRDLGRFGEFISDIYSNNQELGPSSILESPTSWWYGKGQTPALCGPRKTSVVWGRHPGRRLPTSIGSCWEYLGQDILCVCVCETGTHTHNN